MRDYLAMRSYRELWLWLGAAFLGLFAAFIAIGLAYFTKEQHFSFYTSWYAWGSLAAFLVAFACFGCAIKAVAFPPWAKLNFPNISIDIYGGSDIATAQTVANGMQVPAHLRGFKVRITNLENEQNASLTITLFLKLVPGSRGSIGEAVATVPHWSLDPNLSLDVIHMPMVLSPGTTIGGDLVYEIAMYASLNLASGPRTKRLRIVDHISGQARDVVMEGDLGVFGRDDMVASRRGVEILESEEKPKTAEAPDTSGASPPEQSPPSS